MANEKNCEERRFEAAVKVMRSLPQDGTFEPSDDMLVMFYSYYKQATVGPCCTAKPNRWDSIGKVKWEAWKALGDMPKEQAMKEYVQEIKLILETIPVTEEVAELLDELEPFYEVVEDEDEEETSKPAMLATERSDEEYDEDDSSFEEGEVGVELEDSSEDMAGPVVVKRTESELDLLCNGSGDTCSVSSLTNGSHSSLNTEEEEEELACSRENSPDSSELYAAKDHISGDASEQKQSIENSDGDVYSDLMEHPAFREGAGVSRVRLAASRPVGAKRLEEPGGCQERKQQELYLPDPAAAGPVQSGRVSMNRGRAGTHQICDDAEVMHRVEAASTVAKRSMNSQIVTALSRLQDDMQSVLQRLNALEAQTVAQVETFSRECDPHSVSVKKFQWWPLDMSPIAAALALVWPFAVHFLVQLYLQKKRRRIT